MIVSVDHINAAVQSTIKNVRTTIVVGIIVINSRVPVLQAIMMSINAPVNILNVHEVNIGLKNIVIGTSALQVPNMNVSVNHVNAAV
jgi:hypothetical protein